MDTMTVERRAQQAPRLEDEPLVRGLGRFAADVPLTGQTHACFVRSPHAFARYPRDRHRGGAAPRPACSRC